MLMDYIIFHIHVRLKWGCAIINFVQKQKPDNFGVNMQRIVRCYLLFVGTMSRSPRENTEQCESHNTRVISMSNRAKNNLSTIGYHWHVVCPMIDALKPKCKSDGTWLRFTFVNRYNMPICCIISHRELDARARFSFRWPLTTTMEQSKSGNILHHGINRMDGCEIYHEQWALKIKNIIWRLRVWKRFWSRSNIDRINNINEIVSKADKKYSTNALNREADNGWVNRIWFFSCRNCGQWVIYQREKILTIWMDFNESIADAWMITLLCNATEWAEYVSSERSTTETRKFTSVNSKETKLKQMNA